jgi:hypothetical protein
MHRAHIRPAQQTRGVHYHIDACQNRCPLFGSSCAGEINRREPDSRESFRQASVVANNCENFMLAANKICENLAADKPACSQEQNPHISHAPSMTLSQSVA